MLKMRKIFIAALLSLISANLFAAALSLAHSQQQDQNLPLKKSNEKLLLAQATEKKLPASQHAKKKSSYELGRDFANSLIELTKQPKQAEKDEVMRGIQETLENAGGDINKTEAQEFITAMEKAIANRRASKQASSPARGKQYVDDYAKLNAERPGVKVTASGVQYEVLNAGTGKQATMSDTVLVNYQGSLSNGTVFDTTYADGKPASLKLKEIVVPGLKEALLLMHVGDKWRVVIPPKMGFINFGNNRLRRRDLIYEIELIDVNPNKP